MAWTMLAADIESTISPAKMLTGRSYHGRVPVYYSSIGTDNLGRLCRTPGEIALPVRSDFAEYGL